MESFIGSSRRDMKYKAVVIGVSAGGMEALDTIIPDLRADFPVPIVIVQHASPQSDDFLAHFLDEKSNLTVKEADEKEKLAPGMVYIAPSNYHLLVERDQSFSLTVGEKVNYARPSIDVLFETAADTYGPCLIGIILTGASEDGSRGMKKIKETGGLTVVQEPETCRADVMPKSAMAITEIDHVLPLSEIALFLNEITNAKQDKCSHCR